MTKHMSKTRKLLGSLFRIRSWIDLDRIRTISTSLFTGAIKLFTPPKHTPVADEKLPPAEQVEDFKRVASQYHLDNKALNKTAFSLLYWSYCMILFAVLLMALFIYYLIAGSFKACLLTFIGVGLAVILAFRYHFFYYQVKQRKLGCTVKELFQVELMGRK